MCAVCLLSTPRGVNAKLASCFLDIFSLICVCVRVSVCLYESWFPLEVKKRVFSALCARIIGGCEPPG